MSKNSFTMNFTTTIFSRVVYSRAVGAVVALAFSAAAITVSAQGLVDESPPEFNRGQNNGQVQQGQNQTGQASTRTIEVSDNGRDIKIMIEPDGSIYMEVKRHYSASQIDMVIRKIPELEQAVRNFPTVVGEQDIEMSLAVTDRYSAANENELEDLYPGAFNIYKRFLRAANLRRAAGGQTGGPRRGPAGGAVQQPGAGQQVEQRPPVRQIGPAGMVGDGERPRPGMIKDNDQDSAEVDTEPNDVGGTEEGTVIKDTGGGV